MSGQNGEGASDAEVENADPDHEHGLLSVLRERERADERDEQRQHHRHRLLIPDLVVLSVTSDFLSHQPAPERPTDPVAHRGNRPHQREEGVVLDDGLSEELPRTPRLVVPCRTTTRTRSSSTRTASSPRSPRTSTSSASCARPYRSPRPSLRLTRGFRTNSAEAAGATPPPALSARSRPARR